jgi:signal transduction histidine kinase
MDRALSNVLRNAAQASLPGSPVEVVASEVKRHLVIEVRDHGPGIPPGQEEQIFEPFKTHRVRGTGLGLAIARRVIDAHDGKISARNHADGGAVFRIEIPA